MKKKPKKVSKAQAINFGKIMDDYFNKINSLDDDRKKYDVFHKNKWLGRVYYKEKRC